MTKRGQSLASCDDEALYVADNQDHCVQKLRLADGAHLCRIGAGALGDVSSGDGEGQFDAPVGLCVAEGVLYVCDENNCRVVALGVDLVWRYAFGRQGSGDGEFERPVGVVMHDNELYVVDQDTHRVQVCGTRDLVLCARKAHIAPRPLIPLLGRCLCLIIADG